MQLTKLQAFRQAAYFYLGKAHDATFELTDAVLSTRHAYSLADLSQSSVFRRRWPSIYEALQDSRPQRQKLMRHYIQQMPMQVRPLLAGDHTIWPRPHAVTLQDRTIEHQPTLVPGNHPIAVGEGFSTIAWIPELEGSWALPLRHERITSWETPIEKAAWQLQQVCQHLPLRPISLWDSEYGCASFVLKSADIPADKLMRLRSNRCLWGTPPPYLGKGRPRVHGEKFKLNDPTTWGEPAQNFEVDTPKLGRLRIRLWHNLHFRQAAKHPMQLLRLERMDEQHACRASKPLWLAWLGEKMPSIDQVWRLYLRRFAIEHWYRFAKQRLHWTLPKFSTPKQAERWSDLMPLMSWELWLAREIVADNPLPWQKSQANLTPGRVAQAFPAVLAVIGTPARPPKTRGKSPGWPEGKPRQRRTRYPIVKKGRKRATKRPKKTA